PPVLAWLLQPLVGVDAHVITVGAVLVLNASLALFIWLALRALKVEDWQLATLLVLVALAFEPVVGNVAEGQVNLVLLGLSGLRSAAERDSSKITHRAAPSRGCSTRTHSSQSPAAPRRRES